MINGLIFLFALGSFASCNSSEPKNDLKCREIQKTQEEVPKNDSVEPSASDVDELEDPYDKLLGTWIEYAHFGGIDVNPVESGKAFRTTLVFLDSGIVEVYQRDTLLSIDTIHISPPYQYADSVFDFRGFVIGGMTPFKNFSNASYLEASLRATDTMILSPVMGINYLFYRELK